MPQATFAEIRTGLRALAALSALPPRWNDFDADAIGQSLASVLVNLLKADLVCVFVASGPQSIEVACGPDGRIPAGRIPAIRTSLRASRIGRRHKTESVLTGRPVTVFSTALRSNGHGSLIVASQRTDFPTGIDKLILRIAANQAGTAIERQERLAARTLLAKLVDLSSNFIGVANLEGVPLFINPSGLRLVGLASVQQAVGLHVANLLEIRDRDRARYEVWPEVLSKGSWSGELSFLNANTGRATPLLVESFRIDAPTKEPIAVGTISVDIRKWSQAERQSTNPQDLARTRQMMLAIARIGNLSEREGEVLRALGSGHSHKVIAHDLGISVRTVEGHRARMIKRLGVRTLAEAIKILMISGDAK